MVFDAKTILTLMVMDVQNLGNSMVVDAKTILILMVMGAQNLGNSCGTSIELDAKTT